MIKIYALKTNDTDTSVEHLLCELDSDCGRDIHPAIAHYKRQGYHTFRIVDDQ